MLSERERSEALASFVQWVGERNRATRPEPEEIWLTAWERAQAPQGPRGGCWVRSMAEQPTKTGCYVVADRGHSGYVLSLCEYWEGQRPITNEFWFKDMPLPAPPKSDSPYEKEA